MMPESLSKDAKLLELMVNSFMPRVLLLLMSCEAVNRDSNLHWLTSITAISFNHLASLKLFDQMGAKDGNIRVTSTKKAYLYAQCHPH